MIRVSNSRNPDQAWNYVGPNDLQRLSAEDAGKLTVKMIWEDNNQ